MGIHVFDQHTSESYFKLLLVLLLLLVCSYVELQFALILLQSLLVY